MARKRNEIDPAHRDLLIQKVFATFGKEIHSGFECNDLFRDIKRSVGQSASTTTLRRFLGFIDGPFSVAPHTLNILSLYCGYNDWNEFLSSGRRGTKTPALSQDVVRQYESFYRTRTYDEKDINFHNACKIIATHVLSNGELRQGLMKKLAALPLGQVFFYERFPYIDGLCQDYKQGIRFYLQNRPVTDAQVFGRCLLALSAFLANKPAELALEYRTLNEIALSPAWHPFLIGRYIGSQLLHALVTNNEDARLKWLAEAEKYNEHFKQPARVAFWIFPYFQFMIGDYLNLIGEYRMSYKMLHPFKSFPKSEVHIEDGYYEAMNIIMAVSYAGMGKPEQARKRWHSVDRTRLGYIFRKYYQLQYLAVNFTRQAGRPSKRNSLALEIGELVRETGFNRFKIV